MRCANARLLSYLDTTNNCQKITTRNFVIYIYGRPYHCVRSDCNCVMNEGYSLISISASISTGMPNGSSAMPTAERECCPASFL